MAAKNLREALFKAFEKRQQTVSFDLMEQLEGELRDFFAHEVMRYEARRGSGLFSEGVKEFFDHIFQNIPAVKPPKVD